MTNKPLLYYPVTGFIFMSHKIKSLAMHMTRWTGKSPVNIHPKHLLGLREDMYWYLPHLRSTDTLLDVGCGNGMHTLKAATRVQKATGIELNTKNYHDAVHLKDYKKVENAEFILGSAVEKRLPFADHSFDKVICLDVLEHVHERQDLLREMRRVLKPEGILILSVPSTESQWRGFLRKAGAFSYSDPDHKIEYTRQEFVDELTSGGFRATQWVPCIYDTPLIAFIDLVGGISLKWYEQLTEWNAARGERYPSESTGFRVLCQPLPIHHPEPASIRSA